MLMYCQLAYRNTLQWNVNPNRADFVQEKTCENIICKWCPFCSRFNVIWWLISARMLEQLSDGNLDTITELALQLLAYHDQFIIVYNILLKLFLIIDSVCFLLLNLFTTLPPPPPPPPTHTHAHTRLPAIYCESDPYVQNANYKKNISTIV